MVRFRPTAYVETSRKRAGFATKQRRERDALPLFADIIAAGQHSVEEEMARRADLPARVITPSRKATQRRLQPRVTAGGRPAGVRRYDGYVRLPQLFGKPPMPISRGHGFVTIYSGDHIGWEGLEQDIPGEHR